MLPSLRSLAQIHSDNSSRAIIGLVAGLVRSSNCRPIPDQLDL